MSVRRKTRILTEEEIDKIVVAQTDDDSAWGKPVRVRKTKRLPSRFPLPWQHG